MPEKAIENKNRKRGLKVAAIAGGLMLVGGVAFAYWTQGGSGVGSASTGDTEDVTVHQTSTVSDLAPGKPAQALSGNFDNPNDGPVYVTSVTVAISSIDSPGSCAVDDFTLVQPQAVNAEVASGNAQGSWSGGSIAFNDKPSVNQDGCKNATVHLAYTAH